MSHSPRGLLLGFVFKTVFGNCFLYKTVRIPPSFSWGFISGRFEWHGVSVLRSVIFKSLGRK